MTTLKEFEDALREQGMHMALAILQKLRDREKRTVSPGRRITGRKMTPELARRILELHGTTDMTQQEIAFQLGVNQGRVNEVIKRGKWLHDDPASPEAQARDRAKARMAEKSVRRPTAKPSAGAVHRKKKARPSGNQAQLSLGDL